MGGKNILLVEGEADRAFFEELCRQFGIAVVTVAVPKDIEAKKTTRDTKEGVFAVLPTLLKQLGDGQTEKFALIVDADNLAHGGGYQKAFDRVSAIVESQGYTPYAANSVKGSVFKHNDGLADVGLWVMPDNASEGMLENWIMQCRHPNEDVLYQHGCAAIDAIPGGAKFKKLHQIKAEVATWLAWQEKPGHGLYSAVTPDLLDANAPLYAELRAWLEHVFAKKPSPTEFDEPGAGDLA